MDFLKSHKEEMEIVNNNDLSPLKDYISFFIDKILNEYEMDVHTRECLRKILIDETELVKKLFLENQRDKKDYKFSTYFLWHAHEKLKNRKDIKQISK
jgi:hypothetical protein